MGLITSPERTSPTLHPCQDSTSSRISPSPTSRTRHIKASAASREASKCDVAIAGGGLGGLIAAHALRKANPGIDVKIFEQFPAIEKAGALIGVAPNSQKALQAIDADLLQQVLAASVTDGKNIFSSNEGVILREGRTDAGMGLAVTKGEEEERMHRMVPLRLGWWELHQILSAAQPPGSIVFDSKFSEYEESGDEVAVTFSSPNGEESSSVSTKVLIGADGAFSRVRKQCLDDGIPKASGTVAWRARIPIEQMANLLEEEVIERMFRGDHRFAAVWLVSENPREGCWVCSTNKDVLTEMGVDFESNPGARTGHQVLPVGKSAHDRVMKVMSGFPKMLTDVIAATDPNAVAEHGMWTRQVTEQWGKGRVSLLGDSAHPMRPSSGQGFGQAAEDAHALATAVREGGLNSESLRAYEAHRFPRVAHIEAVEEALANAAYQKDGEHSRKQQQEVVKQGNYIEYLLDYELAPL